MGLNGSAEVTFGLHEEEHGISSSDVDSVGMGGEGLLLMRRPGWASPSDLILAVMNRGGRGHRLISEP